MHNEINTFGLIKTKIDNKKCLNSKKSLETTDKD